MKKFLKKLLDSGNRAVEAHLLLLCLGALALVGLSAYQAICLKYLFDPNSFGQGLGVLLAGGGAAALGQGIQRKMDNGVRNESYK